MRDDRPEQQQPSALLESYLNEKRKVYPAHTNRASQIGHPCERRLVYLRTAWRQALPPDLRLQGILEFGTDYERALKRRLNDAGYLLREPHRPNAWEQFQLTGTDDGDISWDDGKTWHLMEIKGLHTFYFDRVENWRSFLEMGPIYAKYPAQLQIYMLMHGESESYFVIGRKGAYDVKFLPVALDYEYAESLLKKCERINAHVAAGTLPDKVEDPAVCDTCEFREHCLPDVFYGPGAKILDTPAFVELLEKRDALAGERSTIEGQYRAISKQIKRIVGEHPVLVAGDFQIQRKMVKRRAIPATEFAKVEIKRLRPGAQSSDENETTDDGEST